MRVCIFCVMIIVFGFVGIKPGFTQNNSLTCYEGRKLLFATRGAIGQATQDSNLTEKDIEILQQVAETQKYYGAIAFSPDEGIFSNATVAAANYHDIETARKVALVECDTKRTTSTQMCEIIMDILPRNYQPGRAIQLNMDASRAVTEECRRKTNIIFLAISKETGHWGLSDNQQDSIVICENNKAQDCEILFQN